MASQQKFFASAARRRQGAFLAVLAVLSLAAPSGLSAARYGATLRLRLLDGRQMEGELLAVKGDVLILMNWSGSEAQAAIGEVAEMRIVRASRVGKGLTSGLLAGFVLGALIVLPSMLSNSNDYGVWPIVMVGGMGGGAGAIIGAGAGLIAGSDETIRCQERDAAWRSIVLKRLQRLARFRDPEGGATRGRPGQEAAAAARTLASGGGEFKHWRASAALVQSPPTFRQGAADMIAGFCYGDPVAPGATGSTEMGSGDGQRSSVGLRDIGIDYFLTRRWAIGIRLNPFFGRDSVYGRRAMRVAGEGMDASWSLYTESKTYFLIASYSLVVADGFLRRTALRLNAGVGWNRYGVDYWESGYKRNGYDYPAILNYHVQADRQDSTSLSALLEAEAAQYLSSRWSLALHAGFRYVPLRVRGEELIGRITRRAPDPGQDFNLTIPGTTLNIGGFYIGVKLGFHF